MAPARSTTPEPQPLLMAPVDEGTTRAQWVFDGVPRSATLNPAVLAAAAPAFAPSR